MTESSSPSIGKLPASLIERAMTPSVVCTNGPSESDPKRELENVPINI